MLTGEQLKRIGIARAINHANVVVPKWKDFAISAMTEYARTHSAFTTEDCRNAIENTLPIPPNKRAWGAVAAHLVKTGILVRKDMVQAKNSTVHSMWITLWQSKIYHP